MGVISNAEAAEGRRRPGWSPPRRRLSVRSPRSPEEARALAGILADPSLREHQVSGGGGGAHCVESNPTRRDRGGPTDAGTQPTRVSDPVVSRTPAPPFPRFPGAGPGPLPPDPPAGSRGAHPQGRRPGGGIWSPPGNRASGGLAGRHASRACFAVSDPCRPVGCGGVGGGPGGGGGVIPIPQPVGDISSISYVDIVGDFKLEPQDHAAVFAGCGRMGMGAVPSICRR